ncbi:MAG: hypothetical protein H8E00_00495 [Deltaproteobacteria bacterium]|nr:hypothetical protein [Deltaproteobacteria bacterium]
MKPTFFFSVAFLALNIIFISLKPANCMDLSYELRLSGDGTSRPHVILTVQNVSSATLDMVFNWPVLDGLGNLYPNFLNFIEDVSVTDADGRVLSIRWSDRTVVDTNWYWGFVHPIYYKCGSVETLGSNNITIQYDVSSNAEILSAMGATDEAFLDNTRPKDFWHGFLENILLRPWVHGDVSSATLRIALPEGWNYATIYPNTSNDVVTLGTMDYMYGDNIRWKNYQRSPFILYNASKFVAQSRVVSGIKVIDICSIELDKDRNQEAFYQYFEYMNNVIGILPIYAYLTFNMYISGDIEFQKVFSALPYGYEHGVTGEFYSAAGGDIGAWGSSLAEVPLWAFDGWGPEEQPHLFHANMIRPWILLFIQFDPFAPWFKSGFWTYYENMTAAQRYGLDNIIDRRFKPMYKYYIDNIAGPPEVDAKNSWNHTFLEYYKPCLTAYYIDQLLKENSNGTKTINDLMKLLFQKAEQGIAINREIFTEALNSLTNYDFTSVIENYLYGTGKLPLDGYLTNAPKVITGSATSVTSTSATLNGTVNPKGEAATYYFEYGTSTNYGSTTSSASAGSGSSAVSVSAPISGLISDTTYHYRLAATNSEGTSYGDDKTFNIVILYVESSGSCRGNTPCYTTIQEAIDLGSSGAIIKIAVGVYDEGLIIDTSNDLILQGGWDATFSTQSSSTVINSLTINGTGGTVEIDNIVLQESD